MPSRVGIFYADSSNQVGFLDSAGNWTFRTQTGGGMDWRISNTVKMSLDNQRQYDEHRRHQRRYGYRCEQRCDFQLTVRWRLHCFAS